jgi:hypothetical protein
VTQRVIDAFEVVNIDHEDRDLLLMTLGTEDSLVQAILKPRAVGQAGELVVEGKIAYMIIQSLLLGDVAAGDGDPVAKLDDLGVDPGCLDHVVVDEDLRR